MSRCFDFSFRGRNANKWFGIRVIASYLKSLHPTSNSCTRRLRCVARFELGARRYFENLNFDTTTEKRSYSIV